MTERSKQNKHLVSNQDDDIDNGDDDSVGNGDDDGVADGADGADKHLTHLSQAVSYTHLRAHETLRHL
eukprot:3283606-Ditylum_brightwellii.AAC.1